MTSNYQATSQDEVLNVRTNEAESIVDNSSSSVESEPLISRSGQFLDPDDPIVSPLNLHSVRLLRFGLVVVSFINVILSFVFIINDFISIPGLFNRGNSFLNLDLLLISLFTNLITLWCFQVPVYYERVLGYISSVLLIIDFAVVFVISQLRQQLGMVGNVILLWTILNVIANCFVDYKIQKAKEYQEIRYTGRIEKRKSFFELLVTTIKIISKLFLLLVIWNISLNLYLRAFDTHIEPWGKLVDVSNDQYRVHLYCSGDVHNESSQPIVLMEGGQLTSSEEFQEWVEELFNLGKVDRYCIWDRPGYGFSDGAPSPISITLVAELLDEALRKEDINGPFSLVGFDIGGLYSKMFASMNQEKIHSILLVDSWNEDLLRNRPFAGLKNEPDDTFHNILELMNTRTGLLLWLKGIVSPLGIVQNIHWFFHPRRYSSNSRLFGSDMRLNSKYIRARLQEQITSSILSYNEIRGVDIRAIPLSVISSDFMIKKSLNWGKWQRDLTKQSNNAQEWVIAENSGHKIWKSTKGRQQLQELLLRLIGENSSVPPKIN